MYVIGGCTYEDTEELKSFLKNTYKDEKNLLIENVQMKDYIDLYYQRFKHRIRCKDIKYIEAYNGYTEFMVGSKRFRRQESLTEIGEMLDKSVFVRIQRGYIVNLRHIESYHNMEIQVAGKKLMVSRRRRKNFEELYTRYDIMTCS